MRFRNLRIAWAVLWGVAAVLLIVLWVRSYWRIDSLFGVGSPPQFFAVGCERGVVAVAGNPNLLALRSATDWTLQGFPLGPGPPTQGFLGFHYETSQLQGTRLRFPIWFPLILSAAATAVRWIRRFSLRTLLIATTLVAVVPGLAVWAATK
jgi:hypothetical protein